jgi:hypothetical protein
MAAKTPQQEAAVNRLRAWAVGPEGQKQFRWGTPGDFKRCQDFYADKIPLRMIPGWCATLHKLATGATPGHAPAEAAIAKAKGK